MTIVCYDGEILAADKMSRIKNSKGKVTSSRLDREKISVGFRYAHVEGEPVLMVGRAGKSKLSKAVIEHLYTHKTLRTLEKNLRKRFPEGLSKGCRLLVVTPNKVVRMRVSKDLEFSLKAFPRHAKIALGTGYRHAEFMMREKGMDAVQTASALQVFYSCCGGGVDYITRIMHSSGLQVCHHPIPKSRLEHRIEFLTHMRQAIDQRLKNLGAEPCLN